ncbi:hypothetical protein FQA39_LY06184 [Lamprigera yunnana]|nr:hypothetical protein FQA39_LY06184 [Lamprigera yunnana]
MIEAGKEESKVATECGDVNSEGTLLISEIVDGTWSERSYTINYNALSGVKSDILEFEKDFKHLIKKMIENFCSQLMLKWK